MLDLEGHPIIDKHAIVGGCVRLPLRTDHERLQAEVAALPAELWGTTDGRVGVHAAADALFLRGYAPIEGDKPIEDRPVLDRLPYIRSLIEEMIPAPPLRAVIARLPAGAKITPHVDLSPYFQKSLRIHIPVETNEQVWMFSRGQPHQMRAGEVWVLNNCAQHAVWNRHSTLPRTHLICDFLPTAELIALIQQGDRNLGRPISEVHGFAAARSSA